MQSNKHGKLEKGRVTEISNDSNQTQNLIEQYLEGGQIPWSSGYKPYRMGLLQEVLRNEELLQTFWEGESLPENYGFGIDERIVEYPWVLSRLGQNQGRLLDAGSVLNYSYLLDLPQLETKSITIMTLDPEHLEKRNNVSYLYGDLRDILIRDNVFDYIVCISTLEHIGLDNTVFYTNEAKYKETKPQDYRKVMSELQRVLAPGGRLLLTVPFGLPQNFGWMQQIDSSGLIEIAKAFGAQPINTTFFQYLPQGWIISDEQACSECEYFNVHSTSEPASDRAAAARAVACLEFVKDLDTLNSDHGYLLDLFEDSQGEEGKSVESTLSSSRAIKRLTACLKNSERDFLQERQRNAILAEKLHNKDVKLAQLQAQIYQLERESQAQLREIYKRDGKVAELQTQISRLEQKSQTRLEEIHKRDARLLQLQAKVESLKKELRLSIGDKILRKIKRFGLGK